MKKMLMNIVFLFGLTLLCSSCYTYTYTSGTGPQTGVVVKEKNHYFIGGLAQGKQSNPQVLAGDTDNYQVTIKHTFIDGLINALTFGIYTPTTTEVQR